MCDGWKPSNREENEARLSWKPPNHAIDEISNETRSSQETICLTDNCDIQRNNTPSLSSTSVFGLHGVSAAAPGVGFQLTEEDVGKPLLKANNSGGALFQLREDDTVGITTTAAPAATSAEAEPPICMDEETQMQVFGAGCQDNGKMESPRDMISPGDPEDASSPFEAMESDVDSIQSSSNTGYRRPLPPDSISHQLSTTTPGGSSDDEYSMNGDSSMNGRRTIKRRKKHRMNGGEIAYSWRCDFARYNSPASSQIPSPSLSVNDQWNPDNEDTNACSTATFLANKPNMFNNSDSNLHATINASRRQSNASEASLNTSQTR